jgi:hypothetical protein
MDTPPDRIKKANAQGRGAKDVQKIKKMYCGISIL